MLTTILLTLLSVPSHADDLLLFAPFDGRPDAVIARGSARQVGSPSLEFAEGLHAGAVMLRADCRFSVPGNFSPEAGTVALWLRPHWPGTDPTSRHVFCLYGQRNLPNSWAINRYNITCSGGNCAFTIFPREEGKTLSISSSIAHWQPQEWHHIAATWRNVNSGKADAEMTLYLDGVPVNGLRGKRIDVGPTDDVMAIGRDQDASPDYANADADDLFIYSRALAVEEIAAAVRRAQAGEPYDVKVPATAAPSVVEGWWDARWPFRAQVILPAGERPREDILVQCPLHPGADLVALGIPAAEEPRSLRVVDEQGAVLPCAVEDGLASWQAPGSLAPGQTRRFHLYFRVGRYEVAAPLWARRVLDLGEPEPSPIRPVSWHDYATDTTGKPWNFDDGTFSGIDQWGDKPEYLRNKKVENGILSMDVSTDPFFIWGDMWGQVPAANRKVAIDLDKYPILEMRVRQSVERATWQLFGRVGTSTNLLTHSFPVTGSGWQRIRIDLTNDARWGGVLSAFRIDPTQGVDAHVEIDWVSLRAVTLVQHGPVETLGDPTGTAAQVTLAVPQRRVTAGEPQDLTVTVADATGKPVAGQPVRVELSVASGGHFEDGGQPSLSLGRRARRGLTDADGKLGVRYVASERAAEAADGLTACAEFSAAPAASLTVDTLPGPPHHYRVEPTRALAVRAGDLPLKVTAQLVDQFGNALPEARRVTWETDEGGTVAPSGGSALQSTTCLFRADASVRWVYTVRVRDEQGLAGESASICLLPAGPRKDPIVVGESGYFVKAGDGRGSRALDDAHTRDWRHGPAWLPLGGFYANWVGLPEGGEEGRRVISFVDATEEQIVHWLDFLASQGVTALRFMLRAHRPNGMEPMDLIGRVNMPLFAKILRYMDLARKHDIRFMLTIHEDYTKPAYYDRHALETFCLPQYAGEDLDKLPPHQRRFIRDRKLIRVIGDKYTDPDVMACQEQYARELVGLLKDNPQLFSWEFENEMVDCPASWANHMAEVIRSVDPVTPICASHGGGGLHTADPLWWRTQTAIDFYTYHLYAGTWSTSAEVDYGAAVDVLTRYGRMAGRCMLGESSGDEFSYYPKERDAERRFIMRDIIWFSLVNGNPGCFFWNARGNEVAEFRLANRIASALDWSTWQRQPAELGVIVGHSLEDDKYYRTQQGIADYWQMGRITQACLSAGVDADFTMDGQGYARTCDLSDAVPPQAPARIRVAPGWQVAYNARQGFSQGLAYIRNFAGIRHWQVEGRANMYVRERKPAPLVIKLDLPLSRVSLTATDLDTGEERKWEGAGQAELDLGTTEHDWALVW